MAPQQESRREPLAAAMTAGLSRLAISLDSGQQEALIDYLLLLDKWNGAYNLSGIRDVAAMLSYHLLDSLALVPYIDGEVILDAGTGAGLPGIPLAISYPEKAFLLLDSNGKKTRFLFQVKTELKLENVSIFHERLERFQSPRQIDIVLCRAFASLRDFVAGAAHLLGDNGRLLAMKGQFPEDEIADLPEGFFVKDITALTVPGVEGPRHLVDIRRTSGE